MFLKGQNTKSKQKPEKWAKIMWLGWVFVVFLMVGSIVRNIQKVVLIRSQLHEQKETIERMEEENKKLIESVTLRQKPDFVESEARNKLGLVKEGEISVVLPEDEILIKLAPETENQKNYEFDPNWKLWFKLFY